MKYFIDSEFIEGFHQPLFGKRRHFIDLISIGIIAEDGRKYEALSSEFNYSDASDWVKVNVIVPLYHEKVEVSLQNSVPIHKFQKYGGKSNIQIANEIIEFVNPELERLNLDYMYRYQLPEVSQFVDSKLKKHLERHNVTIADKDTANRKYVAQPTFAAYFGSYDWVLFCSLFGTMMDLPKGFPMYCIDLKQILDEKAERIFSAMTGDDADVADKTFEEKLAFVKAHDDYPKELNEHNALSDAIFNRDLHAFLNKY